MRRARLFRDRQQAGDDLAKHLLPYGELSPIVLGLLRGGIPVAQQVARGLRARLDMWGVAKLGAPLDSELGVGAVAEGGEVFLDDEIVHHAKATPTEMRSVVDATAARLAQRCLALRRGRRTPRVRNQTVIVVDDGVATGSSARAALRALRRRSPRRLLFGAPIIASSALRALRLEADEVVCVVSDPDLYAVGHWYDDFRPVSDAEIQAALDACRQGQSAGPSIER